MVDKASDSGSSIGSPASPNQAAQAATMSGDGPSKLSPSETPTRPDSNTAATAQTASSSSSQKVGEQGSQTTLPQPAMTAASKAIGERRVKAVLSDENDNDQRKDTEAALRGQKEYVENYRLEKKLYNPVADLPRLHPEPDYIIKTRPPMWDDWRLNIFRGIKENRLKMEANKIARRKCWESGGAFEKCSVVSGMWKTGFRCKNEFNNFVNCCYHEQHVELDKLRRDTKSHDEWYWLNLYDEDGEIGKQAVWEPESSLTGIWGTFLYNMFYKAAHQGVKDDGNKETWQDRNKRLEYLRKKQGEDIDALKSEWELDFHLDENRAMDLNGVIDKNIYNV